MSGFRKGRSACPGYPNILINTTTSRLITLNQLTSFTMNLHCTLQLIYDQRRADLPEKLPYYSIFAPSNNLVSIAIRLHLYRSALHTSPKPLREKLRRDNSNFRLYILLIFFCSLVYSSSNISPNEKIKYVLPYRVQ